MTESDKFWMEVYIAFIRSGNVLTYNRDLNIDAKTVADQAVKDLDKMMTKGGRNNG